MQRSRGTPTSRYSDADGEGPITLRGDQHLQPGAAVIVIRDEQTVVSPPPLDWAPSIPASVHLSRPRASAGAPQLSFVTHARFIAPTDQEERGQRRGSREGYGRGARYRRRARNADADADPPRGEARTAQARLVRGGGAPDAPCASCLYVLLSSVVSEKLMGTPGLAETHARPMR